MFVFDECCLLSGRGPRFGLYLIPCKFNFPNCKYFLEESNFELLTYLLTPWCGVLLEKLTGL